MENRMLAVRLQAEQAAELEAAARVDGVPVSEEVRTAIAAHLTARRKDKAFRARLRASLERNREILERLADS